MRDFKDLIIAVDFDGTCVTHEFPNVGKDIGAAPVLKELTDRGAKLILWTMRSFGQEFEPCVMRGALQWFSDNKIPLWGINSNPEQSGWTKSPKAHAHLLIDDIALGIPLTYDMRISDRPFVNWKEVRGLLGL